MGAPERRAFLLYSAGYAAGFGRGNLHMAQQLRPGMDRQRASGDECRLCPDAG